MRIPPLYLPALCLALLAGCGKSQEPSSVCVPNAVTNCPEVTR